MMSKKPKLRVVTRAHLLRLRRCWRRQGKKVVFTNGVFDIIHRGHIELLCKARSYGDILVVGVNTDASTRRIKGPGRPLNNEHDRAMVLAALESVDWVCLFSESTPGELIQALQPDVLVKGAEYARKQIVGADLVKTWGGAVRRIPMVRGYSTTRLVRSLPPR